MLGTVRATLIVAVAALSLAPWASARGGAERAPLLKLAADHSVRAGERAHFVGAVVPAQRVRVGLYSGSSLLATALAKRDGTFRLAARVVAPGPYRARVSGLVSNPVRILILPKLEARLVGRRVVGTPLTLVAHLRPAAAGTIRVRVLHGDRQTFVRVFHGRARVALGTTQTLGVRVELATVPQAGYAGRSVTLRAALQLPTLRVGSAGSAVVALASRLTELHYAVPGASDTYGWSLLDSIYAFQKVQGLQRDGVVSTATWARLAHPLVPSPRYREPADHIEIDKSRQVLFVVRAGAIAQILPVSTAGIAGYYTPVGRFSIYRKVPGLDPSPLGVLLNPLYFYGGYAIHGNPSVPPYPASHGCIRIPNWISPAFYAQHDYGETVYIY